GVEARPVDGERLLALELHGLPAPKDSCGCRRQEAGAENFVEDAESLEEGKDTRAEGLADAPPCEIAPLDENHAMPQLGQAQSKDGSGGTAADDGDVRLHHGVRRPGTSPVAGRPGVRMTRGSSAASRGCSRRQDVRAE